MVDDLRLAHKEAIIEIQEEYQQAIQEQYNQIQVIQHDNVGLQD